MMSMKKVITNNEKVVAYTVKPYIYEVSCMGRKEFYEDSWDAFSSDLNVNHDSAQVIKIPVKQASERALDWALLGNGGNSLSSDMYDHKFKNHKHYKIIWVCKWAEIEIMAFITIATLLTLISNLLK